MPHRHLYVLVALALLGAGCAMEVKRHPVELLAATPERGQRFATSQAVELVLESGYPRSIAAGTEFIVVGRVAQGLVLKPTQTVLTVEGAHMHEAYAVLHAGQLVGFYPPVEHAFAPLPLAVSLPLLERKSP
ncbi:hypothetical protein [Piscinibacter sp. HJYY11]|uniref:hypothetical protein n=1 Tax=Piscinibacter sp. HJYY11 TaxID=2801333 RepID=UPI00191F0369|nr:hypothetical protein [Piscinibacter sp. HJYY11]MBL0728912.1 hypothetical protein [Piscinibacter sp. HJYY11]